MYIEQDFAGPACLDLQANRRIRNRILRYWPTVVVDGVPILTKLIIYMSGFVLQTPSHLKLYKLLGIKLDELLEEEWEGIDNYYLYFKIVQGLEEDLSTAVLERTVMDMAPFTEKSVNTAPEPDRSEWITTEISYQPLNVSSSDNVPSNDQIISTIRNTPQVASYDAINSNLLTVVALLDTNDDLFEKKFSVRNVTLTEVDQYLQINRMNKSKVFKEAGLTMQFRRKLVEDTVQDSVLGAVASYINGISIAETNLDVQAKRLYRTLVPFTDDDLILSRERGLVHTPLGPEIIGSTVSGYKVSGLRAMPSRTFNKTILRQLESGYTEKKVSGWKKALTMIAVMVIIVVAWFTPVGWGAFAWASTVLTIGTLAMIGLSVILARHDPAWAAYIGKSTVVLGYVATAVGIINIVSTLVKSLAAEAVKEAAKEAAKEAGKEAGKEVIKELSLQEAITVIENLSFDQLSDALVGMIKTSFSSTTSMNMTNVLSWVTKGFQLYTKYIAPPDKGVDDLQKKVNEQEAVMQAEGINEDLSSPSLKDKIDYVFSSPLYNIYDFNEYMQGIPYSMTEGKINQSFNKYYDGTTSKVKYRGYLG